MDGCRRRSKNWCRSICRAVPENPLMGEGNLIAYDPNPASPCLYAPTGPSANAAGKPAGGKPVPERSLRFYLRGRPEGRSTTGPAASQVSPIG